MAPRAIPEMSASMANECCVCFRSASEAGLLIKCSQCVNCLCSECEAQCAQPLKCPVCRVELIQPPIPAEPEVLIGVPFPLEQEMADLMAVIEDFEDNPPVLEAPGFVQEAFGEINEGFGWDSASWWFDRLRVGELTSVPWMVFQELHGLPSVTLDFMYTHQVYARKIRFGFVDEPDVTIERVTVKLFHNEVVEQEWEYTFEFFQ